MHAHSGRNYAFIDSQNVHLAIRNQGWTVDWKRFRRYLKDKYNVAKAFIFIGYIPGKKARYTLLQQAGFVVIFKPTLTIKRGTTGMLKGNVDAELVLHTMIEWNNYDKATIASGDGDFHCLIKHLLRHNKLLNVMIPHQKKFSLLLREFGTHLVFMNSLRKRISTERGA